MKLEQLDALHKAGLDIKNLNLGKMSLISKIFSHKSLEKLSIGAFLDAVSASKPSDVYSIVAHDLNVRFATQNDKCILVREWMDQMNIWSKMFENIERLVIIPQSYGNEWNTASSKVNVPVEISLIDRLAKRNNLSWDDASTISVPQVILMMTIDRREEYFNYLVTQKSKSKNL